jgi:hypothetical protein
VNVAGLLIDDADLPKLDGHKPYLGANGYAYISSHATGPLTVHSQIIGPIPPGHHIDHINGNKLDNRRENLRVVSASVNQANRKRLNKNNSSGMRGVSLTKLSKKKPWKAQIMANRKQLHLGLFATKEEAIAARIAAEIKYYGEECSREAA